jgi:Protein of unknown function (DUF2807).
MKTIKTILILCAALCFATACKKEVDMTLIQKTVLENADIRQIEVGDAWQVTVVADSSTFVELEYSAYLEPYMKTKMEGTQLEIGFTSKVYPVMGSVYKAKVHTAHFNRVEAKDATILNFEGSFYSDDDSLNIVLNDAPFATASISVENTTKCRLTMLQNLWVFILMGRIIWSMSKMPPFAKAVLKQGSTSLHFWKMPRSWLLSRVQLLTARLHFGTEVL